MEEILLLVLAGLLAGFIDSIVGGGGIITLPAILATGMDPHVALGTNKVAGTGASGMATVQYARAGLLERRFAWLFPAALAGSILGAKTVLSVPDTFIQAMVAAVMITMVAYVLLRPSFGKIDQRSDTLRTLLILAVWVTFVGFYDGFLGPGTGNLLLFGIVAIAGLPFLPAAAHGRLYNFGSNLGALGLFAMADSIRWDVGLPMMAATMTGAYIGSRSNLKHGERWIRPLFVLVAGVLFARLMWQLFAT